MDSEQVYVAFLLCFFIIIPLSRPVTVFIHELGHAIPVWLYTRMPVDVYIGSFGNKFNTFHFSVGQISFWISTNPFSWRRGLCAPTATFIPIQQQINYTLSGPVSSFICVLIFSSIVFLTPVSLLAKAILVIFCLSALYDLLRDLVPNKRPIYMADGRVTYNDGESIRRLLQYRKLPPAYAAALEKFKEEKEEEGIAIFEQIAAQGHYYLVDKYLLAVYLRERKYTAAEKIAVGMTRFKLDADDLCNIGVLYSHLQQYDLAKEYYQKSLGLSPHHKYALNNLGDTYNQIGEHAFALLVLDRVVHIDPDFAYGYNNRGYAKIKLGKPEEGLRDINYSLELDPENATAYKNLGIYHFTQGYTSNAIHYFKQAKEMDPLLEGIDEWIRQAGE